MAAGDVLSRCRRDAARLEKTARQADERGRARGSSLPRRPRPYFTFSARATGLVADGEAWRRCRKRRN